jgi:pimeloyl-ACP methyl ester carboxylesterase
MASSRSRWPAPVSDLLVGFGDPEASTVTLESGVTLSCGVRGDPSGPVVVLLPGPTDSWRSYEPVLARLSSEVRAIAVSQRGHGDSDKPATGYRVEDFAGDVMLMLDALGIEQAVIAGHSGSCLVARRVALDHPDRVGGLVLEASPTTLRGDAGLEAFVETVSVPEDPIDREFAVLCGQHLVERGGACTPRAVGGRAPEGAGASVAGDVRRTLALRRHGRAGAHHRADAADLG